MTGVNAPERPHQQETIMNPITQKKTSFLQKIKPFFATLLALLKKYDVYISTAAAAVSTAILVTGYVWTDYNMMLTAVNILWAFSILNGLIRFRKRFFLLFFQLALYLFLIGRPTIDMIKKNEWWTQFSPIPVQLSLITLFLSLFVLLAASHLYTRFLQKPFDKIENQERKPQRLYDPLIRKILFIVFCVCFVASMIIELDMFIHMWGKPYEQMYIYQKIDNLFIALLDGLMLPFLCAYLASFPKKRMTILTLCLYLLTKLPSFLLGSRMGLISAVLFSFLYFCMRHFSNQEEKWIGKFEKILIICMIPVLLIGLGAMNYLRQDNYTSVENMSPADIVEDFLYKQGVSYYALTYSYEYMDQFPDKDSKIYSIGVVTDYLHCNVIAQKVFHTDDYSIRTLETPKRSHIMGNSLSLICFGESRYLNGEGYDSCYIAEAYVDFGYAGVVIVNFLIGAFLLCAPFVLRQRNLLSAAFLVMFSMMYIVPRTSVSHTFALLIQPHFMLTVGICLALMYRKEIAALFKRKKKTV